MSFLVWKTDIVLDAIAAPSEGIILQIENLKASVEIFDELADLNGPLIVS